MFEDREVLALLDRAAADTPPLHLSREQVVGRGEQIVRRRRAAGLGGVASVVALAGALWAGTGEAGVLTGPEDIRPATTVWGPGEAVDATLFAGYQTIDESQQAHSYDGRLTRPVADGPVVLELSDNGEVVESIPAQPVRPGLEVFAGERMTVAVWVEPEGVLTSVPLVGPVDPGGPTGRQSAGEIGGDEVAYAVWPADVAAVPEQVVDVYLVGREEVVSLSGTRMETAVLRAGGEEVLAWFDAARTVWGTVPGPVDGGSDVLLYPVSVPADVPTSTSGWSSADEDGVVGIAVLPRGAQGVEVGGRSTDVEGDVVTLGNRPVVLTTDGPGSVPGADVTVTFELGGRSYEHESYLQDLSTLEVADGTVLSLSTDVEEARTVALTTTSGTRVMLALDADQLDAGPVIERVGGSLVTVAAGWEPGAGVLADARVEVTDARGSRWTTPDDVSQTVLGDGRLVTVLALDTPEDAEVTAVGRQVGAAVERWTPPSAGERAP